MKILLPMIMILCFSALYSQEQDTVYLPYHEIPAYPDNYDGGNVLARMIDGLGYRYYWATEGLDSTDLNYSPSPEGRTTLETIEHIHGLSLLILNAAIKSSNIRPSEKEDLDYISLRNFTLFNLKQASDIFLGKNKEQLESYTISFQRNDNINEFPLWHLINGPIADAMWHVGQVVSFRRSSGNPLNEKVNVFSGKNRE
jgi:hypothetical protein